MLENTATVLSSWCEQIQEAGRTRQPVCITAGHSRDFYGRKTENTTTLDVSSYQGIVHYEASERVITVRAATRLDELLEELAKHGQMLAFEPPLFAASATIGGAVASALAGPRRPWTGAVRDYLLGIRCINGHGQILQFGGRVMKNVAGFDLSRLMCGAMGTLGVLLEISLKVVPKPPYELGLVCHCSRAEGLKILSSCQMPLSGACHDGEQWYFRLSAERRVVEQVATQLQTRWSAKIHPEWESFWQDLRDQRLPFFSGDMPLWRISVPPGSDMDFATEPYLCDWGGAQYWLRSKRSLTALRQQAEESGGHATLFRGGDRNAEVFHPLPAALSSLQQRIQQALDPQMIFNRGRLYPLC